ncbi:MAG TPA: nucleotidyltransferase family protein [Terracidiphilus sp.]|jgi:NDP-sugar pyrophosphorylase family protein|nr:nucleotidyltransferase family protein [Terracidiphilus sp.]
MKAMILAAGLGTRLRPLTNDRPKALVEIGGRTMLEIALARLRAFGIREVIVNTHHFAGMVDEWLRQRGPRDMRIKISHEEVLLDTGGGLKKAAWFFQEPGSEAGEPFLLHNVDVISTIDLARMLSAHRASGALATLAVQDRPTSRPLFFDQKGELCGRRAGLDCPPEFVRSVAVPLALAFAGIHVISPRIFSLLAEEGAFSIIPTYLRLAAQGENITAFRSDGYYWRDLGRPEQIEQSAHEIAAGLYPG